MLLYPKQTLESPYLPVHTLCRRLYDTHSWWQSGILTRTWSCTESRTSPPEWSRIAARWWCCKPGMVFVIEISNIIKTQYSDIKHKRTLTGLWSLISTILWLVPVSVIKFTRIPVYRIYLLIHRVADLVLNCITNWGRNILNITHIILIISMLCLAHWLYCTVLL